MYIIGVYGRSGSGKSTLSKKLASDLGATYVEVDKYWRNIYYSDFFQKVFVPFFKKSKNEEKIQNGKYTDKVNVKDLDVSPKKAEIMRKLLKQYLNYRVSRKLRKTNANVIIFDHIKFYEFDAFKKCDFVIYVNTPNEICEKNIMKRENISQDRMNELVQNHVIERSDEFDHVNNNYSINAFSGNFEQDYETLCEILKISITEKQNAAQQTVSYFKKKRQQKKSQLKDEQNNLKF